MSVHVLLNILNELGKEIKCVACGTFYRFYATSLLNSKNTGVRMLDSLYHMAFELQCNH